MFRFLISSVFLLLVPVLGDTSVCEGASRASVSNFDVHWCISADQRTVIFIINASMYNHFGINYHENMTNANYTIVEIEDGSIKVRNYWTERHQRPRLLEYDGLKVIGIQSDNATFITVKYSLPLNSTNALKPEFVAGSTLNFALAWRNTPTVSNHGTNLLYFQGKLQNDTRTSGITRGPQISTTTLSHGIVLTICWCLLADLAIFLITYRYRVYAYVLHIVLMTLVLVGNLVVVIMMLRKSENLSHFKELTARQQGHLVIGIMILAWFGIQIVSGVIVRILQVFTKVHPKYIKIFSYLHLISGYMMIILAKINVLWGWWMTELRVPFWIVFAWNVAMILLIAMRKFSQTLTKYVGYRNVPSSVKLNTYSTSLQMFVNNRPYNHLDLLPFQYMIFADHVYNTEKFRHLHPGGKYIIDSLKGREIDRFIYGMYAPETLPNFSPFEHSQQIFKAIGPPEFKLNQPIQNGSFIKKQGQYNMVKSEMFSKSLFAVYFAPTTLDEIVTPKHSQGFEYLGQYYTLTAFGKTRLYTRVQCLMPQNKKLQLDVLNKLGYKSSFQVGSHFIPVANPQQPNYPTSRTLVTNNGFYAVGFLMKQYQTGAFTSRLLSSFNQSSPVHISPPLGRGLDIDKIAPGRIVVFAGGTGIFPFMDLIDILFKTIVIEDSHCPAHEVYQLCPVLERHNLLLLYTFEFHVALENLSDIHPVHFNMIHFVTSSRPNLIKFNFKIKQKSTLSMSPGIHYTKERFNTDYINKLGLTSNKLSMIYVCGPPLMNSQLLESFKSIGVGQHQIFIL